MAVYDDRPPADREEYEEGFDEEVETTLPQRTAEQLAAELDGQARNMRLQADRLEFLANEMRKHGLANQRPDLRVVVDYEANIREFLIDNGPSTEPVIEAALGIKRAQLRPLLIALETAFKTAHITNGRTRVWAWMAPDPGGPREARTQEGLVIAALRKDMDVIKRGEAVRLVDKKRTRRGRSTPGVRHKMKLQDAAYERQEAAKAARAEAQRQKAKGN